VAIIQNVNVSTPNDGLGDPLRVSQVKANDNFSELNDKKVEKVAGFDLSANNFTDTDKEKLDSIEENAQVNVRGNWQQQDPDASDFILGKPTDGKILIYGTWNLTGQDLTIFAGWVWKINDVIYSNPIDIVINFPFADTGLQRFDLVAFDTLNSAQRIDGEEVVSSPMVPLLLDNTILFATLLITDSTVGTPSIANYNDNTLATFDYPPLATDGIQDFAVPSGKVVKQMLINGAVQQLETANNALRDDTFTQTGTTVTLKQVTYQGNIISGFYQ